MALDRIVNVHYPDGRPLRGWQATALIIEKTLAAWYPNLRSAPPHVDPSPEEARQALSELPGPAEADVSVVYLGSRQTPGGAWQFTGPGGGCTPFSELAGPALPSHARRIVVMDVCHAPAALGGDLATNSWIVMASAAHERSYELDVASPRPLDLVRRFPRAAAWLAAHMPGEWDGKVSFLGLMWLQARLQTPRAPASEDDWAAFFARMEQEATAFRRLHSAQLASTVCVRPPRDRQPVGAPE